MGVTLPLKFQSDALVTFTVMENDEHITQSVGIDRWKPCYYVFCPGHFLLLMFFLATGRSCSLFSLPRIVKGERLRFIRSFCIKASSRPPGFVRWCRLTPSRHLSKMTADFRYIFTSCRPVLNWPSSPIFYPAPTLAASPLTLFQPNWVRLYYCRYISIFNFGVCWYHGRDFGVTFCYIFIRFSLIAVLSFCLCDPYHRASLSLSLSLSLTASNLFLIYVPSFSLSSGWPQSLTRKQLTSKTTSQNP